MNEPFKCPHCEGSKFSVHGDDPGVVTCATCGRRVKPALRQAQVLRLKWTPKMGPVD
jgi:transcription elongation factor Elf1